MATEVKRRRGTTIEHSTFTGAVAELTVDLTKDTVVVHDGATQGGFPLLREDFSNVPTTSPFTNISLDTAIFDTAYSADGNEAQGTLYWNEDELTLSLVTNGQTTELGQKVEVHVKNQTGAQINKGEVVYASGTVGSSGRITVAKMIADGTVAAKRVVGVAAENIANGADGKVVHFGKIRKVNTDSYDEGDILWVSTTTAGAFQNTEPVQADGDLALPIAFVVTKSVNNGELFVRINAIDENEYQDYDAGLQDISGLTPSDSTIIVGDGTNWVAESGDTARASLGLTIGTHVQAWDAQLDTLSGLSADQATAIVAVTASEYQQLQNIDSVTISNTQWGYLGEIDQSLTQASSPTFAGLTVDGLVVEDEIRTLQSDVIENHLEIESLQDNKVEVGFLFPDGDGQALGTGDNATFNTVTLGEQADSANEAVRADRSITINNDADSVITFDNTTLDLTADRSWTPTVADHADGQRGVVSTGAQDIYGAKTVINDFKVTTKIESASGFTSGIIGAGTIYDMNDGNGSFFEVDNMRVRNELRAHVFKKDIVKASNAYLFITDSAEIAETSVIVDTTDTFRVLADGSNASFAHGDLLWAKNIDDDGSLQVTGVKIEVSVQPQFVWDTSTETWNTSTITPDSYTEFASGTVTGGIHDGKTYTEYNIYEVTSGGTLNAGDTIVRVSGGSILNDASSTYSPFIDIYDGVQTWAQFQDVSKTKVRLGNLEGVSNTSGYGLYTQNAFLTGALVVGDLTKAGNYLEYTGSTMNVVTDTFTLDAGTAYLSSSGTPIMALDTSDASTANISTGTGFYADGAGNLRIGDSDTYLKFDTTNGLQIKIGNDDLSTAIADIRSDLIDIYLGNESTFSGIQFLSGQLVLKAGTGNSIASITLDGTQEDVSTISLDADYIVVTGTTIFKSAKDGSTTPTTLGDATFIDGGTIVTNSITATEIAANTITASEIAAGTITANEIDVADLFAEDATVTGLLTIGSSTSTIKLGRLSTGIFGLEINTNNYWKLQTGIYSFKVGDASNFISFNTSSNVLDITTDTFDLATTNLSIDSANELITIGSADSVSIGKKLNLSASSDIDYRDSLDKYASTVDFFGLYLNPENYFGFVQDNEDFGVSDGYNFRVGGETSNYIEVNGATGDVDINFDTFDLTSGNLRIKSAGTTYPSVNTGATSSNVSSVSFTSAPSATILTLSISDNQWAKFQFDYSLADVSAFNFDMSVEIMKIISGTDTSIGFSDDIIYDLSSIYAYADEATGSTINNITNTSDNSQVSLRFQGTSDSSSTGTITFYMKIFDAGSVDELGLKFINNNTFASGSAEVEEIDGVIYNTVTELNPNGLFQRLTDSIISQNGDTLFNPSLITDA